MNPLATLPIKSHPTDACFDLFAAESKEIGPHGTVAIGTGLIVETPDGYDLDILERSGKALSGLRIGGGICDQNYRGEIKVIVHNTSESSRNINVSEKIAQFRLVKRVDTIIKEVEDINENTDRGSKGFGSSG